MKERKDSVGEDSVSGREGRCIYKRKRNDKVVTVLTENLNFICSCADSKIS